jgi:endonuclease/exonuclease/phosphatase family metal-dependent hydrolase
VPRPSSLRLVTWNVWYDPWKQRERWASLWALLDELDPDLICLQEVLAKHLDGPQLRARRARGFWISDARTSGHDVLMVSRMIPRAHRRHPLPSTKQPELLVASFDTDPPLTVATVHLESSESGQDARVVQLEQVVEQLAADPDVALVGDMNFPPGEPAEAVVADWRDPWLQVHPDDPGYTVDSTDNPMRSVHRPTQKRVRIDRVFVRGGGWEAVAIQRLGTTCVDGDPATFISDHFGLLVELRPVVL